MLVLLVEKIENGCVVREYSRDGKTVSHTVSTPIQEQTQPEIIEIPKDPLLVLQEKQALMQQALDELLLSGGGF